MDAESWASGVDMTTLHLEVKRYIAGEFPLSEIPLVDQAYYARVALDELFSRVNDFLMIEEVEK